MSACQPTVDSIVDRDDVAVHFERYGEGKPAILLLLAAWSMLTSRLWTMQLVYLFRHFAVVSFDGRGSGRSSWPVSAAAYTVRHAGDPVRLELLVMQFAEGVTR
jgi:pimeloyl-ACP methyl ester carboxylesterase